MKLKLNDTVKIGVHWYSIEPAQNYSILNAEEGACLLKDKLKILYDPNAPLSVIMERIIHEYIHGWCTEAGFPDDPKEKFETSEEKIATRLTPVIHQFLLDNLIQEEK